MLNMLGCSVEHPSAAGSPCGSTICTCFTLQTAGTRVNDACTVDLVPQARKAPSPLVSLRCQTLKHSLQTMFHPRPAQVFEGGSVSYAVTTIPTYPTGQIGMLLCCKARPAQGSGSAEGGEPLDPRVPRQAPSKAADELRCGTGAGGKGFDSGHCTPACLARPAARQRTSRGAQGSVYFHGHH